VLHRLALPTPFAVGDVNCWLLEDEPLTLFDCGPSSGAALDVLERALAARGRRVEDLERIVLTHQHLDHLGLAGILARRSGAEVCALRGLAPIAEDFAASADADDVLAERLMVRHGVRPDVAMALRAVSRAYRGYGGSARVDTRLDDGDVLTFASRSLRVLRRPGHSPSDTVFHDEESGELIGGDHLLDRIASSPLIARALPGDPGAGERTRSLVAYLASLRATRELPLRLVLPGHGDPIEDHVRLIDERLRGHERRARRIGRLLAGGPRTAHEIARDLWGDVALTQIYLTLSEVLGHLDLLVDRGEAVERDEGDVRRFAAVS
jgi:glyoxylase-like metal-dependent hydrolase (beta-lactamase superfamily II)